MNTGVERWPRRNASISMEANKTKGEHVHNDGFFLPRQHQSLRKMSTAPGKSQKTARDNRRGAPSSCLSGPLQQKGSCGTDLTATAMYPSSVGPGEGSGRPVSLPLMFIMNVCAHHTSTCQTLDDLGRLSTGDIPSSCTEQLHGLSLRLLSGVQPVSFHGNRQIDTNVCVTERILPRKLACQPFRLLLSISSLASQQGLFL